MKRATAALVSVLGLVGAVTARAQPREATPPPSAKEACIAAAESGQQLRREGKLVAARDEFARCTPTTCPDVVRRDCARWLDEIDAALPTITLRAEDASGAEVEGGELRLDDRVVDRRTASWPVDPGAHRAAYRAADGRAVTREVVLREGERNQVLVLRVPEASARATSSGEAARLPSAPAEGRGPWPWLVGGVGLAALGTGVGFWAAGLDQRADLEARCAPTRSCAEGDVDASRTKLVVGDVLAGVGALALAAGLWLALRPLPSPPSPPSPPGTALVPPWLVTARARAGTATPGVAVPR